MTIQKLNRSAAILDSPSAKGDPRAVPGKVQTMGKQGYGETNASLGTRVRADNPATAASTLWHGSKDGN